MKGYAVIIRRDDGSHFFSISAGFATHVWFSHAEALEHARDCRANTLDAQVVKVEYSDPVILGPKRFLSQEMD